MRRETCIYLLCRKSDVFPPGNIIGSFMGMSTRYLNPKGLEAYLNEDWGDEEE